MEENRYYITINKDEFDTPENNMFLSELEGVEVEENLFYTEINSFDELKTFMLRLEKFGWFGIIDFEDNEIFVEQYTI